MKLDLNIDALTRNRQNILIDTLGGIPLQMDNKKFTQDSIDALREIGLTNIEISLIEDKNKDIGTGYLNIPSSINDSTGRENPWKLQNYNLTKQLEISKNNPALAERLKSEAGL